MRLLIFLFVTVAAQAAAPRISGFSVLAGQSAFVSPGDVIILYGHDMGGDLTTSEAQPYPTQIGATQVQCNGIPAPLLYVSAAQLALQIPWELVTQDQASVVVQVGGTASEALDVSLKPYAPAVFSKDGSGSGQGLIHIVADGKLAAPNSSQPDARAAKPGEVLDIPATGLGIVQEGPPTGFVASEWLPGNPSLRPIVLIGGVPAVISCAGIY